MSLLNTTASSVNLSLRTVSEILNSSSSGSDVFTDMEEQRSFQSPTHWKLIIGFATLFAVSIACVYFVIRCIRGDEDTDGDIPMKPAKKEHPSNSAAVLIVPASDARETTKLLSSQPVMPTSVVSVSNTTSASSSSATFSHSSASASASPPAAAPGVSTTRAKFLEQRKQLAALKITPYGATS